MLTPCQHSWLLWHTFFREFWRISSRKRKVCDTGTVFASSFGSRAEFFKEKKCQKSQENGLGNSVSPRQVEIPPHMVWLAEGYNPLPHTHEHSLTASQWVWVVWRGGEGRLIPSPIFYYILFTFGYPLSNVLQRINLKCQTKYFLM